MTVADQAELERIKQDVVRLTKQHWDATERAYLLTKLGVDLGPDRKAVQGLTGLRFQEFVLRHLKDSLHIIPSPHSQPKSPIYALLPKEVDLSADTSRYFIKKSDVPHYHPSFWAAFAKPLEADTKRYIDTINPPYIHFTDIPKSSSPQEGWIEVPQDLIPAGTTPERDKIALQSIEKWCQANSTDANSFTMGRYHIDMSHEATEAPSRARMVKGNSILHLMIDTLSPDELKKSALPLDVIAKLLRKIP